jgi:hypothetical protein
MLITLIVADYQDMLLGLLHTQTSIPLLPPVRFMFSKTGMSLTRVLQNLMFYHQQLFNLCHYQ